MAKLGLSSPWVIFYNELVAFFKNDKEVKIVYNEDENIVNIYVDSATKADALTQLLPTEKTFGAVTLRVNVIPSNAALLRRGSLNLKFAGQAEALFSNALCGNPNFCFAQTYEGIFSNPITYVVFKKEVVQYFNDSLNDINGICSTLYQTIAKDIFETPEGVYYCTSKEDPFTPTLSF